MQVGLPTRKEKAQGLRNASQCPGLLEKNTFLEKLMTNNPQSREEKILGKWYEVKLASNFWMVEKYFTEWKERNSKA